MQSMGNPTEVDLPLLLARQMHFRFAKRGEKFPLDEKALIEGPFGRGEMGPFMSSLPPPFLSK